MAKDEQKNLSGVDVPSHLKKQNDVQFFLWEKDGKIVQTHFHGYYMGVKEIPDNLNKGKFQTLWVAKSAEDGNVYLIGEKSMMLDMRKQLTEGQEFMLVLKGTKKSKSGIFQYKEFELYC